MRSLFHGGQFAVGLTLGGGITLIFCLLVLQNVSSERLLEDFRREVFWFSMGIILPGAYSIWYTRRDNLRRTFDWVNLMAAAALAEYHNSSEQIASIASYAVTNEEQLKRIPIREFCENWENEVLPVIAYNNNMWKDIRQYKNYLKAVLPGAISGAIDEKSVAVVLNRGETDYFYHIWAITAHTYYYIRSQAGRRWQISEESFSAEIEVFVQIESFLSAGTVRTGKSFGRV